MIYYGGAGGERKIYIACEKYMHLYFQAVYGNKIK